ncbi:basic proline-rich protein-like [Mastomys coucha]|uniref:basic proline-rich protein-like n=1 Tax=Mastomys coucha TaxID=35658 RepID=UPI001262A58D|nr:basic proline-rich protein-like [Mastomys coucha]
MPEPRGPSRSGQGTEGRAGGRQRPRVCRGPRSERRPGAPLTPPYSASQRAPACARPAPPPRRPAATRPAAAEPRRGDAPVPPPPSAGPRLRRPSHPTPPSPEDCPLGPPTAPGAAPARAPARLPPLPRAVHTHACVQRAGASPELRPRPPPRAAAGASPALRGSRARHSHKMSALTELLPAATLRPSPPAYSPPRIRPPTPPSRARGELRVEGERFASLVRAEWTRHPLAVSPSEQHLLTKPIGEARCNDKWEPWNLPTRNSQHTGRTMKKTPKKPIPVALN